jgi:hypothetical protein
MIQLEDDELLFQFPDVHPKATMSIHFQRTLRIPDDGRKYPLPPGLSRFVLRHVDDFADSVPPSWITHGGVMFPMYQAEAMWLRFESQTGYPFAVRVAAGKICAVSGDYWSDGLQDTDWNNQQNYVVVPGQRWLDGFAVEKNVVRQLVAMPLGDGYTAEEQLTGAADYGGLQLQVYPMKRDEFAKRFEVTEPREESPTLFQIATDAEPFAPFSGIKEMGLAPGGQMEQTVNRSGDSPDIGDTEHASTHTKQTVVPSEYPLDVWDTEHTSRCFVHIMNSEHWHAVTGSPPPQPPVSAKTYTDAGLPWFQLYDESQPSVAGSTRLGLLQSVAKVFHTKTGAPLPDNETVEPQTITELRSGLAKDQVREW